MCVCGGGGESELEGGEVGVYECGRGSVCVVCVAVVVL